MIRTRVLKYPETKALYPFFFSKEDKENKDGYDQDYQACSYIHKNFAQREGEPFGDMGEGLAEESVDMIGIKIRPCSYHG